ncbi:nucleotidyltransferase family protein [Acidovorax sp. SRB_24]|uniref:nucleotidyltransferase family protein n=1 Tax=Acidovorax sp. SRB_24 TaxID=1962700 RepID=UPI00145F09C5|nr:nucleotidyltransferase family protein [Acidovorax sp. SRB_24]NMM77897.1 nucleotidyltransferase [Acidovorax sp. SRB_24]
MPRPTASTAPDPRAAHLPATAAAPPALLLAAGRGERMRPLTDTTPKPLLRVQGQPLLEWHLQALARAGVPRVVINTAWLGAQISEHFGHHFGLQPFTDQREQLSISYSHEGLDFGAALETAGGIARALPQLGSIFWLAAGDVFAPDFGFESAAAQAFAASDRLAHLWLVPNPAQHPRGDFGLSPEGLALNLPADDPAPRYTYSTLALLRAELFAPPWCDIPAGNPGGVAAPLAPLLRCAMDAGRVSAALYPGRWVDVGTPERLAALNARS